MGETDPARSASFPGSAFHYSGHRGRNPRLATETRRRASNLPFSSSGDRTDVLLSSFVVPLLPSSCTRPPSKISSPPATATVVFVVQHRRWSSSGNSDGGLRQATATVVFLRQPRCPDPDSASTPATARQSSDLWIKSMVPGGKCAVFISLLLPVRKVYCNFTVSIVHALDLHCEVIDTHTAMIKSVFSQQQFKQHVQAGRRRRRRRASRGEEAYMPASAWNSGNVRGRRSVLADKRAEQRRGQNVENDGKLGVAVTRAHATWGDTMFERQHLSFLIQSSKLMYGFVVLVEYVSVFRILSIS